MHGQPSLEAEVAKRLGLATLRQSFRDIGAFEEVRELVGMLWADLQKVQVEPDILKVVGYMVSNLGRWVARVGRNSRSSSS